MPVRYALPMKNRPFRHRLGFAIAGIASVWRRERSFRTQAVCAGFTLVAMAVLRPGAVWTAVVVLAIALVLVLELVNSALEYLIDHIHPALADPIRDAKDAAAGAVLLAGVGAVAVGAAMLWQLALPSVP